MGGVLVTLVEVKLWRTSGINWYTYGVFIREAVIEEPLEEF